MKAESSVADLLEQQGFEVIDRNWKTRLCEIDIIAQRDKIIFFVEVKYRGAESQGGGFDYITDKKLHKMDFAAQIWKQTYDWDGDFRLMAAAVSGNDCQNIELIELD